MSKLIKRQDVIELIKNSHYDLANSEDDMWSMVADVEKLPVVEAEPVRHGRYIGEGDGYANGELVYDVWKCSECGCVFEDDYEKPTYNYCPNCGARMDAND